MHGPTNVKFINAKQAKETHQHSSTNTRCCVYSFELLMMGGGTA